MNKEKYLLIETKYNRHGARDVFSRKLIFFLEKQGVSFRTINYTGHNEDINNYAIYIVEEDTRLLKEKMVLQKEDGSYVPRLIRKSTIKSQLFRRELPEATVIEVDRNQELGIIKEETNYFRIGFKNWNDLTSKIIKIINEENAA